MEHYLIFAGISDWSTGNWITFIIFLGMLWDYNRLRDKVEELQEKLAISHRVRSNNDKLIMGAVFNELERNKERIYPKTDEGHHVGPSGNFWSIREIIHEADLEAHGKKTSREMVEERERYN